MHRRNGRMLWWSQRQYSSVNKAGSETCQVILRYNRQHYHRTHSLQDTDRKYSKIMDSKPSSCSELVSFCAYWISWIFIEEIGSQTASLAAPAPLPSFGTAKWPAGRQHLSPLRQARSSSERQLVLRDTGRDRLAVNQVAPTSQVTEIRMGPHTVIFKAGLYFAQDNIRDLSPFLYPHFFPPPQQLRSSTSSLIWLPTKPYRPEAHTQICLNPASSSIDVY